MLFFFAFVEFARHKNERLWCHQIIRGNVNNSYFSDSLPSYIKIYPSVNLTANKVTSRLNRHAGEVHEILGVAPGVSRFNKN
jgi:hypothetical protein